LLNSGEKVRLPDVIIVGEKKCGTKALLAFLLEHPQISGFHQEVHLVDTGGMRSKIRTQKFLPLISKMVR